MKWRTTIHVILLVSLTVVKALTQSYWETGLPNALNGPTVAMIVFAQYMRGGTFGKAVKMAEGITDIAKRCAAANRDNIDCLEPLAPKVLKPIKEDSLRQEHTCGILNKFGERTLKALKLAQISQTFPKADFVTVNKLVMDIVNMHKDCCCGDMLDCMHDRERILYYVCTNQDIISSLCMNIPGDTLNFSAQMLLRTGKGYKDLLKECCKTGCPADCCSRGVSAIVIHTTHQWIQVCDHMTGSGYTGNIPIPVKLDLVLGEICRRHLTNPINPGICHCCSSSYTLRRPCMGKLESDESYVPLSLTPGLFSFHDDLCTTEEDKLEQKKQEMLINLIKYKP
ncbi:hypothetical protein Q9966_003512 [Columba livia]|nr:hypothetical protein Q9966_003512 [Columba livia]